MQKNIAVIWAKNVSTCQKIITRIVEMIRDENIRILL